MYYALGSSGGQERQSLPSWTRSLEEKTDSKQTLTIQCDVGDEKGRQELWEQGAGSPTLSLRSPKCTPFLLLL